MQGSCAIDKMKLWCRLSSMPLDISRLLPFHVDYSTYVCPSLCNSTTMLVSRQMLMAELITNKIDIRARGGGKKKYNTTEKG